MMIVFGQEVVYDQSALRTFSKIHNDPTLLS